VIAVVGGVRPVGAVGPTAFSMSPSSGPAGTAVSVGGNGCAPGLLRSSSLDRVIVTMATAPPASVQIPVGSSGAWSGVLTVPLNAAAAPAIVTAVCFTDGLQSLLTIYVPKTFTVTAAAAPPTTTPGSQSPTTTVPEQPRQPPVTRPPGAGAGPTPTTRPPGPVPTQPGADDGAPAVGAPGGSNEPSADPGGSHGGGNVPTAGGKSASPAEPVSVAADLRAPDLTSSGLADGGSGLGWIGRLALLLLLAGVIGGALLFRRYRNNEEETSPTG
jgi:hypothetical protein